MGYYRDKRHRITQETQEHRIGTWEYAQVQGGTRYARILYYKQEIGSGLDDN